MLFHFFNTFSSAKIRINGCLIPIFIYLASIEQVFIAYYLIIMTLFNFHTHTHYCDGCDKPSAYAEIALENNFSSLGFSGHAPLFVDQGWTMTEENASSYCREVSDLKKIHAGKLNVLLGMEADYAPGLHTEFEILRRKFSLDYIIGSVHLVYSPEKNDYWFIDGPEENFISGLENIFENDIKSAVKAFFFQTVNMINSEKFDVIGHIDKIKMNNKGRYFSENDKWYNDLVLLTIEQLNYDGPIVEVNMRGLYKKKSPAAFPDLSIIKECRKRNIRMTISTDAHSPEELPLLFNDAVIILKEGGYKEVWALNHKNIWEAVPI